MTLPPPISGQCVTTRLYDPESGIELLRIDRADQHVTIDPQLIVDVANKPNSRAWLEDTPDGERLLHLHGVNLDVVYRIGVLSRYGHSYSYGEVYAAELISSTMAVTKFLGP